MGEVGTIEDDRTIALQIIYEERLMGMFWALIKIEGGEKADRPI